MIACLGFPYWSVFCEWDASNTELKLRIQRKSCRLQDAHRQRIVDWCDAADGSAAAFDFTTKGVLQEAVAKREYWRLRDGAGRPPGMIGWWPSRAVTFVDNHDTGSTQAHWPFPQQSLHQARPLPFHITVLINGYFLDEQAFSRDACAMLLNLSRACIGCTMLIRASGRSNSPKDRGLDVMPCCVSAGLRIHPDAPGHAVHLLRPPVDGRHAEAQPVAAAARAVACARAQRRHPQQQRGRQPAAPAALRHPPAAAAAPPRPRALRLPGARPPRSLHVRSLPAFLDEQAGVI